MARSNIFNQSIRLAWLDAIASLVLETDDLDEIRERIRTTIGLEVAGKDGIRKSADILINIWYRSRQLAPYLHGQALIQFQQSQRPADRIWLHYGLTMVCNLAFERCVSAIGRLSRFEDDFSSKGVARRIMQDYGPLGSLERTVRGVVWSLRDWGILVGSQKHLHYKPHLRQLTTESADLERWLLCCALAVAEVEELPFQDLLRLPFLFPFRFSIGVGELRDSVEFAVDRHGAGLNMVRLDYGRFSSRAMGSINRC